MRIVLWILIVIGTTVLTAAVALRVLCGRDRDRADRQRTALFPQGDDERVFTTDQLDGLPAAAQRYLAHAIQDHLPYRRAVELTFNGELRADAEGHWAQMRGDYLMDPLRGFVWRMEVTRGRVELGGAEVYLDGHARTRYWSNGFLPSSQSGADLDRTARNRLGFDRIFMPFALLPAAGVRWLGLDDERAVATFDVDGEEVELVFRIAADGAIVAVHTERWANLTDDRMFARIPFGVTCLEERTFDGITIPVRLSYTWWRKTDREQETLRPIISAARFH